MAQRGGKRPGAGRKGGQKNKKTLEREAVMEAMKQRTMKLAQKLMDKQLILASGQQFLYKIEKEIIKGPKGGISYKSKRPELVTSELEIRSYLENLVDKANGDIEDDQNPGATYYFLTSKEPNGPAIDSMLDRTFGRPVNSTKLVDDDGAAVPIVLNISGSVAKKNQL